MGVDERLRSAVRDAAGGHALDEERALQAVRARVPRPTTMPMSTGSVDPVDVVERPRRPARGSRLVALLAACGILAGAVALPFALRSPRTRAPTPPPAASGRCGHDVTRGYRSPAVVRMGQEAPRTSRPRLRADPAPSALALCATVLASAHPRTHEIRFEADRNERGD